MKKAVFLLLLVVFVAPALGDVSLEIAYDPWLDTSWVLLVGGDNSVIAAHDWPVKLPVGYSNQGNSDFLPTVLLEHLRDGAAGSQHADTVDAELWMEDLLGPFASTAVADIGAQFVTLISSLELQWCGTTPSGDRRCPMNCENSDTTKCAGCGCRGTKSVAAN